MNQNANQPGASSAPKSPSAGIEGRTCVSTRNLIIHCFKCVQANQMERAATFYSSCQEDIGYQMIKVMPTNAKFRIKLAKMFFLANDFEKSAVILESLKEYKRAAMLYEKHGDYYMASELYAKVGEPLKGAQMCEKCGRFEDAARLYSEAEQYDRAAVNFERAVNNYLAGQMYYRMGKVNKALESLQRIGEKDGSYLDAVTLIGEILTRHNYVDLAIKKYEAVLKNQGVRRDSLSVAYNYAGLLAKLGKIEQAADLYNRILEVDFQYKDAGELFQKLGSRGQADPKAALDLDAEEEVTELEELVESELSESEGEEGPNETDEDALQRVQDMGSTADVVGIMEGFEFLKKTPLFAELSLSEMKSLYNICDSRKLDLGEILIEQNQPGKALYIIKKGRFAIQKVAGSVVKTIVELGPGIHVGEMSLVENQPTSARVTATEPSEVFEISRERYEKLLFTNDKIALKISGVFIHTLADRLRNTSNELAQLKAEMEQLKAMG